MIADRWRELSEFLDEAFPVNGPKLIEYDLPFNALESAVHACWIASSFGGHRGDNDRPDVVVHFIGRNDCAGSCLFDLVLATR